MSYKESVFLPKTSFPMKGNLSSRESQFIDYWKKINLYQKLRTASEKREKFILHFGPPYANGHIHIGHALNAILKDIVNKTHQMMGYNAPLIPGWDCHGLPIEWKVEEKYRAKKIEKETISPLQIIKDCREFAAQWIEIQKEEFKRLGIIADWENPYLTMNPEAESSIAKDLLDLLMKGFLYRGKKPVLWSVVEKTALADAEVEYKDHQSDSIDVAFPIVSTPLSSLKGVSVVIWTTTPWTLPGNRAIAYGKEFDYVLLVTEEGTDLIAKGSSLLLAKELIEAFSSRSHLKALTIQKTFKGKELEGTLCAHPWRGKGYDFDVPLIPGEHVTTEAGTGFVHTAPGHGLEDFSLAKPFKLEIPDIIQENGTYYEHVPLFAGNHIYKVNPSVLEQLTAVGALLSRNKIIHSYPHSWRSKTPLIYRATSQWFMKMDGLREKALEEIQSVFWFPEQGKRRISSMVENRPDWCLSRQRAWGVPIPLFIHKKTGIPLKDDLINKRIVEIFKKEGIEGWHNHSIEEFISDLYPAAEYEKVQDVLDVWFSSACSHHFVLQNRKEVSWPADVYFEGSDQHRGWFQVSLLHSCALNQKAPYKTVVTHGFVLDEKGYKMSKSLGNVISPQEITKIYGADILRLWIVNSDYSEDLRIGKEILKRQEDIYRRFRNTLRYLLGALSDFKEEEGVPYEALPPLEKYILHKLKILDNQHKECIKSFDYSAFYTALHVFCSVDLSAFYFDIRKDTLYCDSYHSAKRKANRTVLNILFHSILRWLSPVLSFTAEEAWLAYHSDTEPLESIHEQLFYGMPDEWAAPELEAMWVKIRSIRSVVMGALEVERNAKTISSSLEGEVTIYTTSEEAKHLLSQIDMAELSIVSKVTIIWAQPPSEAIILDEVENIGVTVHASKAEKCSRCWRYEEEADTIEAISRKDSEYLCQRCHVIVNGL